MHCGMEYYLYLYINQLTNRKYGNENCISDNDKKLLQNGNY
jgi:hypothetical protein